MVQQMQQQIAAADAAAPGKSWTHPGQVHLDDWECIHFGGCGQEPGDEDTRSQGTVLLSALGGKRCASASLPPIEEDLLLRRAYKWSSFCGQALSPNWGGDIVSGILQRNQLAALHPTATRVWKTNFFYGLLFGHAFFQVVTLDVAVFFASAKESKSPSQLLRESMSLQQQHLQPGWLSPVQALPSKYSYPDLNLSSRARTKKSTISGRANAEVWPNFTTVPVSMVIVDQDDISHRRAATIW